MAAEDDKWLPTPDRKQPDLLLSDCLCPICMSILIEPVTMPCSHELCMPCFRKNVEEANFTCPMCRVRISSWARKRARGNNLVDQKRWKVIQEAFPEKCRRRLEGFEDESFEEEIISHHVPLISQPGEVRKEYEEQLNKLMQQKKQQEELEMKASAELIQKLQNQELKEIAERKKAAEMQRLRDEELAKKLSTNLNEEIPVVEPEPEPEQSYSVLNDEELAKKLYDQINHIPEGDEELARKLQTELNQVCSPQRSPDTPAVPGQAKKTASTHRKGSRSSAGSKESLVSIETFFARAAAKSTTPSMSDSESCAFADYISEPLPSRSSSEATESYDPDQEVLSEIVEEKKQDKANERSERGTRRREKSPSEHGGRNSATSIDSITPELNHFKPIHSSPRTPPKRRQDGTLQTPVIIHTTPCNLNKSKLKEEENWLERSPLVMAKWLSLAEERKQVLANQSKGTMTDSKAVRPSPHALLVTQNGVFNKKKQNIHDGNPQKYTWNTRRQKAPSTITPTKSSEASTLHSGHSSKHDTLLDFTARETYDSIDAGITSLKIPISYKSDSDEEMPPVLLPQKETTKSKVRSQTMPTLVSQSDDLTCKSYNEPTKSSTRAKESETHSTKTRARRKSGNRNNNNSGPKEIESTRNVHKHQRAIKCKWTQRLQKLEQ
ncbi:E3 ubiquitin-protein ligase rnf168-like [Ptychodera flava]|uniref:E3 ubiquitin-protein ligase rnf168-like n=1 Tax=Ptychodera flava TaxID=63121 RepID=UPI00396A2F66